MSGETTIMKVNTCEELLLMSHIFSRAQKRRHILMQECYETGNTHIVFHEGEGPRYRSRKMFLEACKARESIYRQYLFAFVPNEYELMQRIDSITDEKEKIRLWDQKKTANITFCFFVRCYKDEREKMTQHNRIAEQLRRMDKEENEDRELDRMLSDA